MNKIIYEGECEYTYENIRDITIHTRKLSYVIYYAVLFAALVFIEFRYIFIYKNPYFATGLGVAIILLISAYIAMPLLNARKQYRELTAKEDGNMKARVKIYDELIEHINLNTREYVQIGYSEVKKVIETDKLLIIMIKGNIAMAIEKDTLVTEEKEELSDFICDKKRMV